MRTFALIGFVFSSYYSFAQVEGVFVERLSGTDGRTTYRLFIDLEEDHILQTIYGDASHILSLSTTTYFYNDPIAGVLHGEQLDPNSLKQGHGWTDSYLAFGFASTAHKAIPMHLDMDGTILACEDRSNVFCESDGLVAAAFVPQTVNMNVATGYLNQVKGSLIQTDNGGWGVLGGVKGATPENFILVAQVTTDGILSYALNVQVKAPDGTVLRCISGPPTSTEERHVPSLSGSTAQ